MIVQDAPDTGGGRYSHNVLLVESGDYTSPTDRFISTGPTFADEREDGESFGWWQCIEIADVKQDDPSYSSTLYLYVVSPVDDAWLIMLVVTCDGNMDSENCAQM